MTESRTVHGEARRVRQTPEYRAWRSMIARCQPNAWCRKQYADRGITVCSQWRYDYDAFLSHVGRRPSSSHQLDRINNDRGYEPGNVRWATVTEQARNRQSNRTYTYDGEQLTVRQIADKVNMPWRRIDRRLRAGWSVERAIQ